MPKAELTIGTKHLSYFFCGFWRPLSFITHFHVFTMITSYIIYTLIYSLHLSFWPAACVTFNEDEPPTALFLAATLFLEMLPVSCIKWSFNSQFSHPSNRVSFSRFELRIDFHLVSKFASFFSLFLVSLSLSQSWRRDSISRPPRKCTEEKSCILPPRPCRWKICNV